MNKRMNVLTLAAAMAVGGIELVKTRDVAFGYRMGAGFPGDVNRAHPVSIEPCKIYATQPPLLYGGAVICRTASNEVRQPQAGDTAVTTIYGIVVRPNPYAGDAATNYGSIAVGTQVAPPVAGILDILRKGYGWTKVVGTPGKGGAVYLWIAADSGSHKQGYFEAAATGGSTVLLTNAVFNGPPDANGNVEIMVWEALTT